MNTKEHLSELSTYILLIRTLIAAAWADGHYHERERKMIEKVISRVRMSATRREILLFEAEQAPDADYLEAVLEELCHRAKTIEMKDAIIALVDRMIASDHVTDVAEIEFREKLRATLQSKGKNFFTIIKDRLKR